MIILDTLLGKYRWIENRITIPESRRTFGADLLNSPDVSARPGNHLIVLEICAFVLVALLVQGSLNATPARIYTASFDRAGPLDGRMAGEGLDGWEAAPEFVCDDGVLKVRTGVGRKLAARFPMPSLEGAKRLSVKIRLQPANEVDDGISFGFTTKASNNPFNAGALLVIVRGDAHPVAFYSGGDFPPERLAGISGNLSDPPWFDKLYRTNESMTEIFLSYDLEKGSVHLDIAQGGGNMTVFDDAPVAWNGTAGKPVPTGAFEYFTLFFSEQNGMDDGRSPVAGVGTIELQIE